MAKYDELSDKVALRKRAELLKPRLANVVATERGWEHARPNGTMELLVSFKNVDSLLGDSEAQEEFQAGDPIIVESDEYDTIGEDQTEEVDTETKDENRTTPAKRGPKPKVVK